MPQWIGRFHNRSSIAQFVEEQSGQIAGQIIQQGDLWYLQDQSATLELPAAWIALLPKLSPAWAAFSIGPQKVQLDYWQERPLSGPLSEQQTRRFRMIQSIRQFFLAQDFLETDTPVRVPNPGMEPFLDSFSAEAGQWLRTSPELHMKRLLCRGYDRIFQFAPSFRKGDFSRLHREEFLMLEWYRSFSDLEVLIEDCQHLLNHLAPQAKDPIYFKQPIQRITCQEAFHKWVGLDLRDHKDCEPLRAAAKLHNIHIDPADDWDTLYFRLFLNLVEHHLGEEQPTILEDYPASQAALAKRKPQSGEFATCYRFELYVKGVELANAFYEVCDANEQRQRFEMDQLERQAQRKPVYELDEAFLQALQQGMPPSAGIALGLDRLVLVVLGHSDLAEILPF
ncbi:MAG: EF-P lysine aminoacylase GenX [Acidobacteria bacterium]|nr:EF-P lysine aminoacylase GenX [Acidobacteriota bacterium]